MNHGANQFSYLKRRDDYHVSKLVRILVSKVSDAGGDEIDVGLPRVCTNYDSYYSLFKN